MDIVNNNISSPRTLSNDELEFYHKHMIHKLISLKKFQISNNFTNFLFGISKEIIDSKNLDFNIF